MAEQMIDPEAKRMMTGVVETYERLVSRAEPRQVSPKAPGKGLRAGFLRAWGGIAGRHQPPCR
jgi:hypothetical protein